MNLFHSLIANFRFADLLDIAVITVLSFGVLTWLQKRGSRAIFIGSIALAAIYGLARFTHMYVTLLVFQVGFTAGLVILVIIFQEEIRSVFDRLLFWRDYRLKHELVASATTTDLLVETVADLGRDRIGALVVLKGRASLERYLSGGISLNGRLSRPLLYSIFHPKTPSHDGAVVIEADRIEKFAVRLPLSHNIKEIGDRGTRHTAGLGLSELTDALIIIVSEERGTISVAENGRMDQVEAARLRARIGSFYERIFPEAATGKNNRWVSRNTARIIPALGVAVALWLAVSFRTDVMSKTFTLPVVYRNVPSDWVIEAPVPAQVQVSLSGMERAFQFDAAKLSVSINMSDPAKTARMVMIKPENLHLPQGLRASQILPGKIAVNAYKLESRSLPIKVVTRGTIPAYLKVKNILASPGSVNLLIPPQKTTEITRIHTEPVALEKITASTTIRSRLLLPPLTRLEDESQNTVKVLVAVDSVGRKRAR
ncbi:MAG: DNA integrity scanning protein DisA nucleotide-binding domain protein [Chitinispirillaceae bacterium]|nr:DNA integrity scanning protein DisA nucleotide-binding domain protein [Chitinispirillaceae bacterium]